MLPQENKYKSRVIPTLLCAGLGTRLEKITKNIPKPLIKIENLGNQTILSYSIQNLLNFGFKTIITIIGYKGNFVKQEIERLTSELKIPGKNLIIVDSHQEYLKGPLYSFFSVRSTEKLLNSNSIFLIFPGDTVFKKKLLNQIFLKMVKNSEELELYPSIFYTIAKKKIKSAENNPDLILRSKEIPVAVLHGRNKKFLKKINTIQIENDKKIDNINLIYPVFVCPSKILKQLIEFSSNHRVKTIRDFLNLYTKKQFKINAIEIDSYIPFYDIDNEKDIKVLEKVDNRFH